MVWLFDCIEGEGKILFIWFDFCTEMNSRDWEQEKRNKWYQNGLKVRQYMNKTINPSLSSFLCMPTDISYRLQRFFGKMTSLSIRILLSLALTLSLSPQPLPHTDFPRREGMREKVENVIINLICCAQEKRAGMRSRSRVCVAAFVFQVNWPQKIVSPPFPSAKPHPIRRDPLS